MTKEELIARLKDIEWDDFEVKEAADALPKSVWETVSAFSNTSGGWLVLGVKQIGKRFEIQGINNAEKIESDLMNALREGLINFLAHADYFSAMHPTIRVYSNRIEFQNPGRFMVDMEHLRDRSLCQIGRKCGLWHRQDAEMGVADGRESCILGRHRKCCCHLLQTGRERGS